MCKAIMKIAMAMTFVAGINMEDLELICRLIFVLIVATIFVVLIGVGHDIYLSWYINS